ncbi:hypothetical protein EPK99_06435 [Neorhizobium lilium]|uniref:Uncharacterized protein n=1 Tax=Neorhizobium lilium TaxID=2503024 RepID=A0A444LGV7_9HYPH|nr:hypothetical protein [Neorhizobium lilium]RWX78266.1 hypothetical protein EPK99_06435 [Neorhizobium lilium]
MATFDYAEMQAVADELITEFGQAGTITTLAPPNEIEGGDPVEVSYPATLVTMAYDQRYINGSTILAGDVQIYISAVGLAIEPLVGMQVTAGGKTYHVMAGDPNNYDGLTNVVFIVQGRLA